MTSLMMSPTPKKQSCIRYFNKQFSKLRVIFLPDIVQGCSPSCQQNSICVMGNGGEKKCMCKNGFSGDGVSCQGRLWSVNTPAMLGHSLILHFMLQRLILVMIHHFAPAKAHSVSTRGLGCTSVCAVRGTREMD